MKKVDKHSYELHVTQELIDTTKQKCATELKQFVGYSLTQSRLNQINCFLEMWIQEQKLKGNIPECFGTFIAKDSRSYNIGEISLVYERPAYYIYNSKFYVGQKFYKCRYTNSIIVTEYRLKDFWDWCGAHTYILTSSGYDEESFGPAQLESHFSASPKEAMDKMLWKFMEEKEDLDKKIEDIKKEMEKL